MPKKKTQLQSAAGKLISAIQKEWGYEAGEPESEHSFEVMNKAHELLQASDNKENIKKVLNGLSISQFLDELWVQKHPSTKESILKLEKALNN